MDPTNLTAFRVMKARLQYLGQRQEVLAQNIANSDTPNFAPAELQPFTFRMAMGQTGRHLNPVQTQSGHLQAPRTRTGQEVRADADRNFYETTPDGNRVVLEQQLLKVADTSMNYNMVTNLYRKQVGMFRLVTGRQQ